MRYQDVVCFVKDRRGIFNKELIKQGYSVVAPYTDKTLIGRMIREIWYKIKLPQKIWYNKELLKCKAKYLFIEDPLITREYLNWLVSSLPGIVPVFMYENLVGKARHIMPDRIPEGIFVTTFDEGDSKKYHLHLGQPGSYIFPKEPEKKENKYDVIYVGKDKGRASYLLRLQNEMQLYGLKTQFMIMPNGRFHFPNKIYSRPISYNVVQEMLTCTKAVLNVVLPGQIGATIRDFESIFYNVKLITNNKCIKKFDFYCPENVFLLGERNISELPKFLESKYVRIPGNIIENYLLEKRIERFITLLETSI